MTISSKSKKKWELPARAATYKTEIEEAEKKYLLPNNILGRLLYQESRFRNDIITGKVKSRAGAVGIAQIIPRWHPNVDPLNPFESIHYAARYLKTLYNALGSWKRALAAYNWGIGNVRKAINAKGENWLAVAPAETKKYVKEIIEDILA